MDSPKAAVAALVPAINAGSSSWPIPGDLTISILFQIGTDAGIFLEIVGGQGQASAWSSSDEQKPEVTVNFDSVKTVRQALTSQAAMPQLFMRRKIRFDGNMQKLQSLRQQNEGNGSQDDGQFKQFAAKLIAALDAGAAPAVTGLRSQRSAEIWVSDMSSHNCMICMRTFSLIRRRHHCRGCGKLLCSKCAPLTSVSAKFRNDRTKLGALPRRLCTPCRLVDPQVAASMPLLSMQGSPCLQPQPTSTFLPVDLGKRQADLEAQAKLLREQRKELAEQAIFQEIVKIWHVTQGSLGGIAVLLFKYSCYRCLGAYGALILYLVVRPSSGLRRFCTIFWAAFVMFIKYRLTKLRCWAFHLDADEARVQWNQTHEVVAAFLFRTMTKLGGFWNKVGQALSINVVLPDAFLAEFSKFQDRLRASPVEDVLLSLKEEFGLEKLKHLTLDKTAIGTASIAQVHRAKWSPPGGQELDLVVKVQHRGIASKFRQDIAAAVFLARVMALFDTDNVPDMRPFMKTFSEVTKRELDFTLEAKATIRAASAVDKYKVDVVIPQILPELVAEKAMAMTYVNGCRLADLEDELPQVDRGQLVEAMVDHFAASVCAEGHFHVDPHPGNLLVSRDAGKMVVLDWGMVISTTPELAQAHARLFFAVATNDALGVLEALRAVASVKTEDKLDVWLLSRSFRFVFRDSQPLGLAREEFRGAIKAAEDFDQKKKQKHPLESMNGDTAYIFRAMELIYMVSSALNVKHPLLLTIVRRAYAALLPGTDALAAPPRSPHEMLPPFAEQATFRGAVEREVFGLLRELYLNGELLGAQACVRDLSSEAPLVDLGVGVLGWLKPEAVTASTVFNLWDLSKLLVALALLRELDSGRLSLSSKLAEKWPAFEGGADVTVEHVLAHTAGLWHLVPKGVRTSEAFSDFEDMLSVYAAQESLEPAGSRQRYHHASFGYLCAGICRHLGDSELPRCCATLTDRVGCQELRLSVGAAVPVAQPQWPASSADAGEIATLIGMIQQRTERTAGTEDPIQRVVGAMEGAEHLLHGSMLSAPAFRGAQLPGLQAFGTAHALTSLLVAVAKGQVLGQETTREMLRSRRVPLAENEEDGDWLAGHMPGLLQLESFDEWGLGVQLVPPSRWAEESSEPEREPCNASPAWGHLSQGGSMALVLPGPRPLACSLLLNLAPSAGNSHHVAWSLLRVLQKHS